MLELKYLKNQKTLKVLNLSEKELLEIHAECIKENELAVKKYYLSTIWNKRAGVVANVLYKEYRKLTY